MICIGLRALLVKHQRDGLLNGIQVNRNGPRVTYLFFVDDSILFAKADGNKSEQVKLMLKIYEKNFGQKINLDKSTLFFSCNTMHELKSKIKDVLGVQSIENMGKYLGIPGLIGKDRKRAFKELKEVLSPYLILMIPK